MMPFQAMRLRNGGPPSFKTFELLFEGTNGSTSINETFGTTISNTGGGVTISTAQFVGGASSGLFPGNDSSYLSAVAGLADFGAGDFALDVDIRPATVTGTHMIATTRASSGSDPGFLLWTVGTQVRFLCWGPTAGTSIVDITGGTLALNTWSNVRIQRVGTAFTLMQNGSSIGTGTSSAAIVNSANNLRIGQDPSTLGRWFSGYMDNFRMFKGGIA